MLRTPDLQLSGSNPVALVLCFQLRPMSRLLPLLPGAQSSDVVNCPDLHSALARTLRVP